MITRGQPNGSGAGNSIYLQGSAKIHEQSLADMQEVRTYLYLKSAFSLVVLLEIIVKFSNQLYLYLLFCFRFCSSRRRPLLDLELC